jgi:hypothetical protein
MIRSGVFTGNKRVNPEFVVLVAVSELRVFN